MISAWIFLIYICSLCFLVLLIQMTHTHIPCEELLCCCLWKSFCWQPCWCSGSVPPGQRFGSELAGSGQPGSGQASASGSAWSVGWKRLCCSPCCCQAEAASCVEPRRWHWMLAGVRKEIGNKQKQRALTLPQFLHIIKAVGIKMPVKQQLSSILFIL